MLKMERNLYIYELPFEKNIELCRLLDYDDLWKTLADYMKYSTFDIIEIERISRRQGTSPTAELLTRWGQLNHNVDELFILLFKMKFVPAMICVQPLVSKRLHPILSKLKKDVKPSCVDENGNRKASSIQNVSQSSSVPLPVLIAQCQETSTHIRYDDSQSRVESSSVDDSTSHTHDHSQSQGEDYTEMMKKYVLAMPMVKYDELREATNNWSESNLLGKGGFGQVFKGEWKHQTVAVKRLRHNDGKNGELIGEMGLNQYRHDNILPLYAISYGGPEPCLVYQLMTGGSLADRLRLKTHHPPLTWSQRHRIAHGVARGLQFLHTMTGTPLIHGDIKPANILLDQCSMPKIGDFGLARHGAFGEDRTHLKVSRVHGTRPYLPAEYLSRRCLSPAVDVFSFGVVLIETATALPALDQNRQPALLAEFVHTHAATGLDFATLEDRLLAHSSSSDPERCRQFVRLGLWCTEPQRTRRPAMLQVYTALNDTLPAEEKI